MYWKRENLCRKHKKNRENIYDENFLKSWISWSKPHTCVGTLVSSERSLQESTRCSWEWEIWVLRAYYTTKVSSGRDVNLEGGSRVFRRWSVRTSYMRRRMLLRTQVEPSHGGLREIERKKDGSTTTVVFFMIHSFKTYKLRDNGDVWNVKEIGIFDRIRQNEILTLMLVFLRFWVPQIIYFPI